MSATRESPPTLLIRPTRGWSSLGLGQLWEYRELLYFLLWREVKARYRQTLLGPLWFVLSPLVRMVIFTAVFGGLARLPSEDVPYPLFTLSALLPWELFAGAVQRSSTSLVTQIHVISKVYFPRLVVPLAGALSGLVDFAVSFLVLVGMLLAYGVSLEARILLLPLLVLFALATALAVGLWLATLAVRFRDVGQFVGYALSAWMYATPVAYSATLIPERWQALYRLNPMYWVTQGFRSVLLGTDFELDATALWPLVGTLVLLVSGAFVFRRTERSIVDSL